jgi:hypothetical protein
MPGQFGCGVPCDGVVDDPLGVVALGVVVVGVVVLGVVAVPLELAAFAIAAPPPARIPALPTVRRAIRIRFMASTSSYFGSMQRNPTSMRAACAESKNSARGAP